jgi:hypothetical protein
MEYFVAKINYPCLVNGEAKTVTEQYLFDALSYTEVESNCLTLFRSRITEASIENIDNIGKMKATEIVFHGLQDEDAFWQVIVKVLEEKSYKWTFLIPANNDQQASARVREHLGDMMVPFEVVSIKKSEIMAYWKNDSELWKGDWHNRMDRYYAEGRFQIKHTTVEEDKEPDPQLNLFDDAQPPKKAPTKRNFSNLKQSLQQRQGATA